jgi:serine/threonine protein kinase
MSFSVGENVGPYRIIEQLGQGGMATVFKAYHASLDRYVAIKVLHPAFGEDPAFEARFQREARVVAKLEHPNIVPIYDYAEHEKRPYLVMKFIEGDTLKARLDRGPLSSEETLKIVEAVGSALAYAHKQGVLHRDIKPSNVLVAADGQIYLADFGLARIAQSGESTLSGDMLIGTPQYISPEQAMGVRELDERTDVYSLGVMIYEIVVGKVPFSADTPFSIIHDHIYSPLPLPRKVNPGVSEQIERVLLKSLAKDRLDRYATVDQMVAAFKEAWTQAVIPTQTAVATRASMQQAVEAAQRTSPNVGPAKTDSQPVAMATQPNVASSGIKAPKKKRSLWLWIGAGLLLLCCLSFTVNVLRNVWSERSARQPTSLAPDAGNGLPPEIQAAQELANSDPSDPDGQLALALVYWVSDMPDETYKTLDGLAKLVEPDDVTFYSDAGDQFLFMQAWPPSALMYFRAVKPQAAEGKVPAELLTAFHEAVYKSADRVEALQVLPAEEIAEVDERIALILQARHAFYMKDFEQAYLHLDQAKKLSPDMHEATLLEAEFYSFDGKPERARILLLGLQELDSVPDWIQIFAEEIIKRLP